MTFELRGFENDTKGVVAEVARLHERCGIYTRRPTCAKMLRSIGWRENVDLIDKTLLEPAAGEAAFVLEAARVLVRSLRRRRRPLNIKILGPRIVAFELHRPAVCAARTKVAKELVELGVGQRTAEACAKRWIVHGDFLLAPLPREYFSHAVSNPPYIRWSKLPPKLRERYDRVVEKTLKGGDLFLPFLDKTLSHLRPSGRASFLCAEGWRYSAFGETFRAKWLPQLSIEREARVDAAEVFERNVLSYASIVSVRRKQRLARNSPVQMSRKKTLYELGAEIRVGPALGHTAAYVMEADHVDVEDYLLLDWVDGTEVIEGEIATRSRKVIEMHRDGVILKLSHHPRLRSRLRRFKKTLERRNIVKQGRPWWSTIDRVNSKIWARPKLLVPEISSPPRIAMDYRGLIPAHSVYAIFAKDDDLESLWAKLGRGKLAAALEGVAPRLNSGYVRCYKRILEQIRV